MLHTLLACKWEQFYLTMAYGLISWSSASYTYSRDRDPYTLRDCVSDESNLRISSLRKHFGKHYSANYLVYIPPENASRNQNRSWRQLRWRTCGQPPGRYMQVDRGVGRVTEEERDEEEVAPRSRGSARDIWYHKLRVYSMPRMLWTEYLITRSGAPLTANHIEPHDGLSEGGVMLYRISSAPQAAVRVCMVRAFAFLFNILGLILHVI